MSRRSASWPAALCPLVLTLTIASTAACGGNGDGDGGADQATGRFGNVHAGVCAAAAEAERGDDAAARRAFSDVHVGLHDLAAALEREDRAAAARLLETKQRVEANGGTEALVALSEAVAEGIERTGGSAPNKCP